MIGGALVLALLFLIGSIYFGLRLPGVDKFNGGNFFESDISKLTKMLNSDPPKAGIDQAIFWRKMKPMTIELFEKYWD